jgi:hypothetical protein
MYGHVNPLDVIRPGKTLSDGECIGTIADPSSKGRTLRPHLHISTTWILNSVPLERLDWSSINDNSGIRIIDPLSILDLPYSVLAGE